MPSQSHISDDRKQEAIELLDTAIRDHHLSIEGLKIEWLSGERLRLEGRYNNLALTDRKDVKRQETNQNILFLEARLCLEAGDDSEHELFALRKLPNNSVVEPRRIFREGRAGIGKTMASAPITQANMDCKTFSRKHMYCKPKTAMR